MVVACRVENEDMGRVKIRRLFQRVLGIVAIFSEFLWDFYEFLPKYSLTNHDKSCLNPPLTRKHARISPAPGRIYIGFLVIPGRYARSAADAGQYAEGSVSSWPNVPAILRVMPIYLATLMIPKAIIQNT